VSSQKQEEGSDMLALKLESKYPSTENKTIAPSLLSAAVGRLMQGLKKFSLTQDNRSSRSKTKK